MVQSLHELDSLIEQSWNQYKPSMGYYAMLVLVSGLIAFVAYFLLVAAVFLLGAESLAPLADVLFSNTSFTSFKEVPASAYIAAALVVLPLIAGLFVIASWQNAVLWVAITNDSERSIITSLKKSFSVSPRFLTMDFLRILAITIGAILFLIPGILLAGWYLFSDIAVVKGAGVIESLKQSMRLVRGRWWPVVGRFIIIAIAVVIIPQLLIALPGIFGISDESSEKIVRWVMMGYTAIISIITTFFVDPWFKVFKKVLYEDAARTAPNAQSYDAQQTPQP